MSSAKSGQQRLDFPLPAAIPARPAAAPGTLIDCDALTASLSSRITAFAFDATIVLGATAVFLTTARFWMGAIPLDRKALMFFAAAALLIGILYKTLWCLGNADTPGMRWAKLRLISFNGRRPTRSQRIRRALAAVVSLAGMGLGLLWALVDEEALTWHDHSSKTFPTAD